jgi:hypothetical protein
MMSADTMGATEQAWTRRIKALAQRCRELSNMTAVPELVHELNNIADELENEAEMAWEE